VAQQAGQHRNIPIPGKTPNSEAALACWPAADGEGIVSHAGDQPVAGPGPVRGHHQPPPETAAVQRQGGNRV
jgi:hypothetical protein